MAVFRKLKQQLLLLLQQQDAEIAMTAIAALSPRRAINPLFGFLCHGNPQVRWRAVTAMGMVVARMAEIDPEGARVVMRRLMWHLNDESGGIGWGAPEAMGETMARSSRMADEYSRILISYLDPHGNYLEHEGLQAGVLWAVGRLARIRPALMQAAAPFLTDPLNSPRTLLRGLAAWVAVAIPTPDLVAVLSPLVREETVIEIYLAPERVQRSIGSLATEALMACRTVG